MTQTITRRFEWDSGHRIVGHESKCKNLHGHRYVADVTFAGRQLDQLGRLIDFGVLKELVGTWIDENWDHNMLLHCDDPLIKAVEKLIQYTPSEVYAEMGMKIRGWEEFVFGREPYIFPDGRNPTAENIAIILYRQVEHLLAKNELSPLNGGYIYVTGVLIYETPKCWSECSYLYQPNS